MAKDDAHCLKLIRQKFREFAPAVSQPRGTPPLKSAEGLYEILPSDHRLPYDMQQIIERIFDGGEYLEFQPDYAPEIICANMRLCGRPVAVVANRRGFLKTEERPRLGGIVYTESAQKVAYFVENAERNGTPLVYLQDVSGFMVGVEAESDAIIRAGAAMVEAMACATVPKIVLTLNHASGAGYYAMAAQGFDPSFTFGWPTARIGVMEGDAAVQAIHGPELAKLKRRGEEIPAGLKAKIEATRADYERWLDAGHAAARGYMDAIVDPLDTRRVLSFALEAACYRSNRRHLVLENL